MPYRADQVAFQIPVTHRPTISAFVTTRAGPHRRASYQAALSITEDIGTAIGPIGGLALAAAQGTPEQPEQPGSAPS